MKYIIILFQFCICLFSLLSCKSKTTSALDELVKQLHLKKGEIISCGPADPDFGTVDFAMTCNEKAKKDFNLAIELLHSFEYDEAEKAFAKVIDKTPDCAMAYWGVAMCNFHPLWSPPGEKELQKGAQAIAIANSIKTQSARETDYINAIGLFYKNWKITDHHSRCIYFEKAMEQLHNNYPDDKEATIFYALALDASADPTDKTYANQKKAGLLLSELYKTEPDHPGIIHYIIHTYDYPELADLALPAARRYASVAPSSAHALHMPSHIFTRLGLWDECIQSNIKSVDAARCYAASAQIAGHWDEELHGMDYLVYAYLQKGENKMAAEQLHYLDTIKRVYPVNFKIAYAFAAIPCRYVLENKLWKQAAVLQVNQANFSWKNFPWQEAIIHFTRLLGNAHTGNREAAKMELGKLYQLRDTLLKQKDFYKSKEVEVQIKEAEAWMQFCFSNQAEAIRTMEAAANMEDSTEKHPVTPGEVLPARELLGDMLMAANQNSKALQAYQEALQKSPNRLNSLYGAGTSAWKMGNRSTAIDYYSKLLKDRKAESAGRPELANARLVLEK